MEVRKKKSEDLKRFIEGIIYVLLIIVVIVANTYGGIVFRLIPLLFLLGFIGKVFYSRPVITSLFGGVFSVITMYVNGTYTTYEILTTSLTNLVLISLGEIFGICVILTLVTMGSKIKKRQSTRYVFITILFFALSVVVTCYMNGNIFSYLSAEGKLKDYLSKNYVDENFEVSGHRHIPYNESGYSFKVKNIKNENIYKFIVYDDKNAKIYDEYINSLMILKNNNIKKYIINNNIDKEFNIEIESEYVKIDKARMVAKCVVENEENYYDEYSKKIVDFMNKIILFDNYKDIYEIEFVIRNKNNVNINTIFIEICEYLKYIEKNEENIYILNLLNVEFFDFNNGGNNGKIH